jgi:hypothetical protein
MFWSKGFETVSDSLFALAAVVAAVLVGLGVPAADGANTTAGIPGMFPIKFYDQN